LIVKAKNSLSSIFFLSLIFLLLLICPAKDCLATVITAEILEYYPEDAIYIATGNVRLEKEHITITADRLAFNELTSELETEGNIVFQDKDAAITAKRALINIDAKTGNIHDAVIFFKKDNYWITGKTISKMGEKTYYAPYATFTTCNSEPYLTPERYPLGYSEQPSDVILESPDWCFNGQDVHIELGKTLSAKHVTYRIKGLPVIYSPYILTPILTERRTGFLAPILGMSSKKGFQFSPAFYWAIDDDKDATFYLDYLSKRGYGKGIEYRYLDSTGIGSWQAYHLRDRKLGKDFSAFRVEDRFQFNKLEGFVRINYINDADFYKEYGYNLDGRITNLGGLTDVNRFFQSSAEFYLPLNNSRLYFLSQYWVDLADKDAHTLQRLPEIGYTIHPTRVGPFLLGLTSSISNFYREKEVKGQRLLLNPAVSHSFGDAVRFFQSVSLIQALYNLTSYTGDNSTPHKGFLEYRANALTRFYKFYSSFVHDIELSFGYRYISGVDQPQVFDFIELKNNTSQLELSLYNSIKAKNLNASVRLIQPYDLNPKTDNKNLLPLTMDVAINSEPFILRFEAAYDFNKNHAERLNSMINIRVSEKISLFAGERYDRTNDIKFFSVGLENAISKRLAIGANLSYDAKLKRLRDASIRTLYKQQCWALNAVFSRKPKDLTRSAEYNISLMFELTGIGKLRTL
jgi:LPS-assembly protein